MYAAAAFVVSLALVPFAVFRLYARRIESMDESVEARIHRLDRVQQVGGFVLPVVANVGLFWLDLPDRLAGVVWSGPEPFGVDVLELAVTVVVIVAVAALPYVSMIVGMYPTSARSVRRRPRRRESPGKHCSGSSWLGQSPASRSPAYSP